MTSKHFIKYMMVTSLCLVNLPILANCIYTVGPGKNNTAIYSESCQVAMTEQQCKDLTKTAGYTITHRSYKNGSCTYIATKQR